MRPVNLDHSPRDVLHELYVVMLCQPELGSDSIIFQEEKGQIDRWKRKCTEFTIVEVFTEHGVTLSIGSEYARCPATISLPLDSYIALLGSWFPEELFTCEEWYDQLMYEWHEIVMAE